MPSVENQSNLFTGLFVFGATSFIIFALIVFFSCLRHRKSKKSKRTAAIRDRLRFREAQFSNPPRTARSSPVVLSLQTVSSPDPDLDYGLNLKPARRPRAILPLPVLLPGEWIEYDPVITPPRNSHHQASDSCCVRARSLSTLGDGSVRRMRGLSLLGDGSLRRMSSRASFWTAREVLDGAGEDLGVGVDGGRDRDMDRGGKVWWENV